MFEPEVCGNEVVEDNKCRCGNLAIYSNGYKRVCYNCMLWCIEDGETGWVKLEDEDLINE